MNNLKVEIYACYLPGSTNPDYIGSHNVESNAADKTTRWRYSVCRYMGQGLWLNKATGTLTGSKKTKMRTCWGSLLLSMLPEARLAIRVETMVIVNEGDRWKVELAVINFYKPPYNKIGIMGLGITSDNSKEYQKNYRKEHNTEEKRRLNREYQKTYSRKPLTEEQRRRNKEYRKTYIKGYYERNPEKLEAKNVAHRLRMRARRMANLPTSAIPTPPL